MENIENQLQFPHELQLLHKTPLKQAPNQIENQISIRVLKLNFTVFRTVHWNT